MGATVIGSESGMATENDAGARKIADVFSNPIRGVNDQYIGLLLLKPSHRASAGIIVGAIDAVREGSQGSLDSARIEQAIVGRAIEPAVQSQIRDTSKRARDGGPNAFALGAFPKIFQRDAGRPLVSQADAADIESGANKRGTRVQVMQLGAAENNNAMLMTHGAVRARSERKFDREERTQFSVPFSRGRARLLSSNSGSVPVAQYRREGHRLYGTPDRIC